MASGLATCPFLADIGRIAGNVEDHVSGMIVECGIGVGRHIIYYPYDTPMVVVVALACAAEMALRAANMVWSTVMA